MASSWLNRIAYSHTCQTQGDNLLLSPFANEAQARMMWLQAFLWVSELSIMTLLATQGSARAPEVT